MYKLCLFDLDGTLVNTLDSMVYTTNKTLAELGDYSLSPQKCAEFVGNGTGVLMEKALRETGALGVEDFTSVMARFNRNFADGCVYKVRPYQGMPALLETLIERGARLAVLTNKPDRAAKKVMETAYGKDVFAWIQGQREDVPRKPDPTAAWAICHRFGVEPSQCCYVGDSEVDIETARNGGMDPLIVTWGFRSKEELIRAGAPLLLDTPEALLEALLQGGKGGGKHDL